MEAVIVIDVQVGPFAGPVRPDDASGTLRRINEIIGAARRAGRPVIFLQHEEPPDFVRGTPEWELNPELDRRPADVVVRKTTCDGFCRTSLEEELGRIGAKTLIVAGYATEFCVDSTVRAATSLGYHVVVVSDGHTTHDRGSFSAAEIKRLHNWVWPNLAADPPVTLKPAAEIRFG